MVHGVQTGNQLVAYSVTFVPGHDAATLIRQLEISLGTLRVYSPIIEVVLFCHGELPSTLHQICAVHDVMVHYDRPYSERLHALCPRGAAALAQYPLLHKFLNFEALVGSNYTQVLCCDCDTVFFDDVAKLFERHGGQADLTAREEVHSRRSPYGPDSAFIDEALLENLASSEGRHYIPPFNLGFVLIESTDWQQWVAMQVSFVDDAWRFACGMALDPLDPAAPYAEFAGLNETLSTMTAHDIERALPFPSNNRWLLDETSLWLTLGRFPSLITADFPASEVAQNGEFEQVQDAQSNCVACHYFSSSFDRIERWIASGRSPLTFRH